MCEAEREMERVGVFEGVEQSQQKAALDEFAPLELEQAFNSTFVKRRGGQSRLSPSIIFYMYFILPQKGGGGQESFTALQQLWLL